MTPLARVTIPGNAGACAEMTSLPGGQVVTGVSVAVIERWRA